MPVCGIIEVEDNTMNDTSYSRYDISQELLQKRYLKRDPTGNIIETPQQMYMRVARTAAEVEKQYNGTEAQVQQLSEVFYKLMADGLFQPNSPTLMNAGEKEGLLSACFVLPVNDSIDEIFQAVRNTAIIQKAGGGTGFTFDRLRPAGDLVGSTGGMTSGPISFWKVIAETTNAIQQGAHRRGANMGMMTIEHPDIVKFVHAKQDPEAFHNFNISVKITDRFFDTLHNNPNAPHVVTNLRTGLAYVLPKSIPVHTYRLQDLELKDNQKGPCFSVQDVWQMIVDNAYATGEPGICFIDRINRDNPTPHLGSISTTNPCGEQPLMDYEACNLGSINVSKFVQPDRGDLDWEKLAQTFQYAVRFLDNVIDVNYWPIPEIREMSLGNRKIGLGIMGFADALVLLGIRYDSDEAVMLADKLGNSIQTAAHKASETLARERGSFPNWKGSVWDREYHKPMRNAACSTIAPTGSISIIAGCSSGIEPIYKTACKRLALDSSEFIQIHPLLERVGTEQGWMTDEVRAKLRSGEPANKIKEIPRELSDVLITAHEISPQWHVRMQAAFQTHIDNAVSKTVNLPAQATIQDVDRIFKLAYKLGCKGITVYRDNCRPKQVLSGATESHPSEDERTVPRARPKTTSGLSTKFRMGCGTLFVTVNRDEKGICEVFANLGKAGGCPSQTEATCRAVSAALRSGVDPMVMIDQLSKIRCLSTAVARKTNNEVDVLSCPDAIARALREAVGLSEEKEVPLFRQTCEDCGRAMRREANCAVCDFCGISRCG